MEKITKLHTFLKEELDFISRRTVEYVNRKRLEGPNLKRGDIVYLLRRNIKTRRLSSKLDYTKLGLFQVKKRLGLVIYKLLLPVGIRIYLVFHVSLLEEALRGVKPGLIEIDKET